MNIVIHYYNFETLTYKRFTVPRTVSKGGRRIKFNYGAGFEGVSYHRIGVFQLNRLCNTGIMYSYDLRDLDYEREKAIFFKSVNRELVRRLRASSLHKEKVPKGPHVGPLQTPQLG